MRERAGEGEEPGIGPEGYRYRGWCGTVILRQSHGRGSYVLEVGCTAGGREKGERTRDSRGWGGRGGSRGAGEGLTDVATALEIMGGA